MEFPSSVKGMQNKPFKTSIPNTNTTMSINENNMGSQKSIRKHRMSKEQELLKEIRYKSSKSKMKNKYKFVY